MTLGKIGSTNLMYHGVAELEFLQGDGASGLVVPCDVANAKFEVEFYRSSLQSENIVTSAMKGYDQHTDVSMGWLRNSNTLSRGSSVCRRMANQNVNAAFGAWFSGGAQLTQRMSMSMDIPNATNTFWNGGGGSWSASTSWNPPSYVGLLCKALNAGGANGFGRAKVCAFRIWESGTLKHDFAPMRKDGVGRFLDRVTDTWWPTAGTGSFILGPDKT